MEGLARGCSRLGTAGERTADDVRRAGAPRPARNRDADNAGAALLPARAHLPGAPPDPARGPQAGQHRLAIPALLREQQAIPARRAASAPPAPARAAARRIHADALRKRRRPDHRWTRWRPTAPTACGQLRRLGRVDRNPRPRLPHPSGAGGPGGLAPPRNPDCRRNPQPPRRAPRRPPRRRGSRPRNLPSPAGLAQPPPRAPPPRRCGARFRPARHDESEACSLALIRISSSSGFW